MSALSGPHAAGQCAGGAAGSRRGAVGKSARSNGVISENSMRRHLAMLVFAALAAAAAWPAPRSRPAGRSATTTPLHWAVYNGNAGPAGRAGADVNARNDYGAAPRDLRNRQCRHHRAIAEGRRQPGKGGAQTAPTIVARTSNTAAEALLRHRAKVNAAKNGAARPRRGAAAERQPAMKI